MEKPEIAQYSTLDFEGWQATGVLNLTPKFQRREVWKTPARSYFIDSLIRGIPIPPIFIRVAQSADRKKLVREVIDGQQRLRAVLDFKAGKYSLSKGLENYSGKRYDALPQTVQDAIDTFSFVTSVFKNISDSDILEIFARLNTYAVALNAQELRNGRYFGEFKRCAQSLAFWHVQFWREYGIFGEASIARMLEVELTSELLIAFINGQQDKKTSIDKFYLEYDEQFDDRIKMEKRFEGVVDQITTALGSTLKESEFSRPPLFYTLFCVVGHYLFGIPKQNEAVAKKVRLSAAECDKLRDAVIRLSDILNLAKQDKTAIKKRDSEFVTACSRQTDNIQPRQIRFSRLYTEAFS